MRIDFHSHILPEIDDGASSVGESVEMLKILADAGVECVVLTPHFYRQNESIEKFLDRRGKAYEKLCAATQGISGIPKLVLGAEVYFYAAGRFNFAVLFSVMFLTANIFTNSEKYHIDFLKELVFDKNKDNFKFKKVRTYILKEKNSARQLVKRFVPGKHYVIFCEDKDGNVTKILTERQVIEGILKK